MKSAFHFIGESITQSASRFVQRNDDFGEIELSLFEKARRNHFFRARARANTSSAGYALTCPARNSS